MLADSGTGANIRSLNQTSLKELTLPLSPFEIRQEHVIASVEPTDSILYILCREDGIKTLLLIEPEFE